MPAFATATTGKGASIRLCCSLALTFLLLYYFVVPFLGLVQAAQSLNQSGANTF
jgi:hypothetical protein